MARSHGLKADSSRPILEIADEDHQRANRGMRAAVLFPSGNLELFCCEKNSVRQRQEGNTMPLGTILLILLVLVLIGALPTWGYSGSWGYGPSGILGVILVVVLVLVLLGKI